MASSFEKLDVFTIALFNLQSFEKKENQSTVLPSEFCIPKNVDISSQEMKSLNLVKKSGENSLEKGYTHVSYETKGENSKERIIKLYDFLRSKKLDVYYTYNNAHQKISSGELLYSAMVEEFKTKENKVHEFEPKTEGNRSLTLK